MSNDTTPSIRLWLDLSPLTDCYNPRYDWKLYRGRAPSAAVTPLNSWEQAVLDIIKNFYMRYTNTPTIMEISKSLGSTNLDVIATLRSLYYRGYIDVDYSMDNRMMIVLLWR